MGESGGRSTRRSYDSASSYTAYTVVDGSNSYGYSYSYNNDQGYNYDSSDRPQPQNNATLDIIDGINALGEGLQEIADKFYENPEAFLTQIEETLVQGCYDDMERQARDMAQGQAELENAWEELTWRAREAGSVVHRQRAISDRQWGRVQEFVDALNEFGTDPSGYMDMGRDMANAEKQRQCDEFAGIMAEWKEKVLSDLREDDEWVNLQESTCVDGAGADTFGDTCAWYVSNQSGCGNYDHE